MKTRVIALVLAVCMMLGLCAFASAAANDYLCDCGPLFRGNLIHYDFGNGHGEVRCADCGVKISSY